MTARPEEVQGPVCAFCKEEIETTMQAANKSIWLYHPTAEVSLSVSPMDGATSLHRRCVRQLLTEILEKGYIRG